LGIWERNWTGNNGVEVTVNLYRH